MSLLQQEVIMYGPPDSWILREPPAACEWHEEQTKGWCEECEKEREAAIDLMVDQYLEDKALGYL